jgi:uncharacterized protein YdhG (YjbR/CyaY superfamily)
MNSKNVSKSGFTKEEQAAMKARAKEVAAERRANKKREDGEKDILAAIAAMDGSDKESAEKIHDLIKQTAPELWPKTWYGMPAYAKDDKIICFFQSSKKFGSRYATFGFNDSAKLDNGNMWPTSFALLQVTHREEKAITELLRKALE